MDTPAQGRARPSPDVPDPEAPLPAADLALPDRPAWSHPLRTLLALASVSLILVVSATILGLDYYRARSFALEDAKAEMRIFSERLVERFNALSDQTAATVALITSVPNAFLATPPERNGDKALLLREILGRIRYLDGVYAGYPDGSFYHAVSFRNEGWAAALKAPPETAIAFRSITRVLDGTAEQHLVFEDAQGNSLGPGTESPTDYDARQRPWYRAAVGIDRTIAIGPYPMAATRRMGMTIAQSHRMNRRIVVGADIVLDTITDFLAAARITPEAVSFIVDTSGNPVIHSDRAYMDRIIDGAAAAAQPDPLVDSIRADDSWTNEPRLIDVDGRTYLVLLTPIGSSLLLAHHRIVVAAPLDELTAAARSAVVHGLFVSAIVIAAGILLALVLAHLITKSLQLLTESANRLQSLDFTTAIEVPSQVTEIRSLSRAMNRARDAIFTFALYVPKEFVRKGILAGYFTGRGAARQEVTALFTDIFDFTSISEDYSPEQVVAMLSEYFDILDEVVKANGGSIIQFLGDSIFAMWNAPVADPDHAEHACRAALAARARLDAFNRSQSAKGLPAFRTRFGIHTGQAVVGSVGARERLQYTAMGDTINVASRLEGMNKEFGTAILASAAVRQACRGGIVFSPLGFAQAKGRSEALQVYEVVGLEEPASTQAGPAATTGRNDDVVLPLPAGQQPP